MAETNPTDPVENAFVVLRHGLDDESHCHDQLEILEARIDTLETGLDRIITWSEAYPLDIFPEPDFKAVREALKVAGIKIDAVSASNMRRVVVGVGNIARLAR